MWTVGADAALDTRGNPASPGNAVYLVGGLDGAQRGRDWTGINRYTADGARLPAAVRPARARRARALLARRMRHCRLYERLLIGGSSSLRGFRTGAFDGDKTLSHPPNCAMPITSVISGAKLGATIFTDAAKAVNYGERLSDVKWRRGAGAGVFLIASVIRLNLDVSHGFDGGGTRVHLSSGFAF